MPLAPGTLLHNRYRIVSILGQGGMGAVYRASDEHLRIPVAVKENLFLTEEYGRQFQREATILAGLRHSGLPHVTDYFTLENQGQYLVMDFIEGEDLRQRMERMGALPEREAILVGISICDALTYLHTRRPPIVHRDIKPGNIKVTPDGQAVLVDFGLAKIMQMGQVTSTGARAMTPGYSPPEQYGTARTDDRSDIYSLGATLYATLTGVIPEDGLARMTGKTRLTPIREVNPRVNRRLAEAIEMALEVDPEKRYQTADEFKVSLVEAGELSPLYQERPTIAPPPEEPPDPNAPPADPIANEIASRIRERRSGRIRRQKQLRMLAAPAIALALLLIVVLAVRPDWAGMVLAGFRADPTQTAAVTQVASSQTTLPPSTVDPTAASTEPALVVAQVTETPTLEPTATQLAETLVPTATPAGGGWGQIAFTSNRIGKMDIWLINADPNNPAPRQITNFADGACQPSWSPDGLRLAVTSPCPGPIKQDSYPGSNIFLVNADGSGEPVQLTSSLEGSYDPAWSPDGTRIAYVRQFINSQIWYMTDSGQVQNQYSPRGPVNNLWPAWSADGQVMFYSQATTDAAVPVLVYLNYEDRNTPREARIPTDPQGEVGPIAQVDASPDGFWLAYESWPDGVNHDIYLMNTNGSNRQRLTTDPGYDFDPAWRPVGGE